MENNKGQKRRKRDANALMKSNTAYLSLSKLKQVMGNQELKKILSQYVEIRKKYGTKYVATNKDKVFLKDVLDSKLDYQQMLRISKQKSSTDLYKHVGKLVVAIYGAKQ